MKKNLVKILSLCLFLSMAATTKPCSTSYGVGGDIELCVENSDETPSTVLYLPTDHENEAWMATFDEGDDDGSYEE